MYNNHPIRRFGWNPFAIVEEKMSGSKRIQGVEKTGESKKKEREMEEGLTLQHNLNLGTL
jgi:hypothetical protein